MGVLYVLCFDEPVSHATHYLGYADNLDARLREHRAGRGSRLTAAAVARGISWEVYVVLDPATEADEARYKKRSVRKASPAMRKSGHKRGGAVNVFCPVCGAAVRARAAARRAVRKAGLRAVPAGEEDG